MIYLYHHLIIIILLINKLFSSSFERPIVQAGGDFVNQAQCLVLVKWWRTDNRGGKSSWMNITRARVLRVSPPPGSANLKLVTAPRRSSSSASTARRNEDDDGGDEESKPTIKR